MPSIHVISIGSLDPGSFETLRTLFEVTTTTIDPPEPFSWESVADQVNRAIDEVPGWVLLVRGGERVSMRLAEEISRLAMDKPVAWAFRIPVSVEYAGRALYRNAGRPAGDIRLFHSRRCRFLPKGDRRELQTRGTVMRISVALERVLYATEEEHIAVLERSGVPHSLPRRVAIFLASIWSGRRQLTRSTLRYRWIEAGWDRGPINGGSSDDRN